MVEEPISNPIIQNPPKWLKRLQENSWEAEILISGGAIFSLLQIASSLISSGQYFTDVMPFGGEQEVLLILILVLRGVTIGFICHLFLRGFWISLVCLRSVYPNGINFNNLRIKGQYLDQSRRVNLTEQIIELDNLSGLIFFGSFLFILILIGFLITFLVSLSIIRLFQPAWQEASFVKDVFLVLFLVYVADLITAGLLRRNRIVRKAFSPIYWFFNLSSLGFLYRPYLQVVTTNIKKWKVSVFILGLFISSGVFSYVSLKDQFGWNDPFDKRAFPASGQAISMNDEFYRNRKTNESWVRFACIQSEVISDEFLSVFVPYKAEYDKTIVGTHMQSFAGIVSLSVNDSTVTHVEWIDDVRNGQLGIAANLPTNNLPKGKNILAVQILGQQFSFEKNNLEIPFWKE